MQDKVLTIILAGGVGSRLHPLTAERAKPAVPFGGKYRIIDFTLSNCLHSGMRRILVLTQYKSHSLFKHLRDGWSLFNPAVDEYVTVVPPQMRTGESWYQGTADAVYQNLYLIERSEAEHVLVLSGDHIYRMDYQAMLQHHIQNKADVTVACMKVPIESASAFGVVSTEKNDQINLFREKPPRPKTIPGDVHSAMVSMGIYIFSRNLLSDLLIEDATNEDSNHDFGKDIFPQLIHTHRVFSYEFGQEIGRVSTDRYWRDVGTIDAYYQANMDLLTYEPPLDLYQDDWQIYSAACQNPPAKITTGSNSQQKTMIENSMIGSGSIINGAAVSNSILSRNVKVHPKAVVKDSIIFDDVEIGPGVHIEKCIVDKSVSIPAGKKIGLDPYRDKKRFILSNEGVVVIPRNYEFHSLVTPQKPKRVFESKIYVPEKTSA